MSTKIVAQIVSLGMFLFVVEMVRSDRLTFKYAVGWLFISAFGLFSSIFHVYLFDLASWLGFELPSNFIFFSLFGVIVFMGLLFTLFLSQQNRRNDTMAQKIGMLELEVQKLREEISHKSN